MLFDVRCDVQYKRTYRCPLGLFLLPSRIVDHKASVLPDCVRAVWYTSALL